MPALVSSPSDPPLPPTVGRSAMPTSLNQAIIKSSPARGGGPPEGWWRGLTAFRNLASGREPPPSALRAATSPRAGRISLQRPSCVFQHALFVEDGHHP